MRKDRAVERLLQRGRIGDVIIVQVSEQEQIDPAFT